MPPAPPSIATAVATARSAARQGYSLVVGVEPEAAVGGDVAVIALDRTAPVRLEALLARLASQALRPVRVSEAAGIDPATVNAAVGMPTRFNAAAVTAAVRSADLVTAAVDLLFVPLAVLMGARAVVAMALAARHARRARRRRGSGVPWTGPVTVIVPAYNEAAGIAASLRSLVASDWPHGLSVVVVDDGSTDSTPDIVARLGLRRTYLVRQVNQGKPAALNAGLAVAGTEVVVMVDGDTVFEPGTIAELVAPFADPRVGATSGNAKVANRGSLLGRWQHIEYVMGFNLDRRLLASLGTIVTIPGAVGAFRAAALRDVRGVSDDTIAEDTDLTIAIQRAGWRVAYQDRAIAWTEAPSTLGDLWRQRYRWCYGTMQAVWKHRRAVIERRSIGLVGLPYALVFQVIVALLAPIVDVAAAVWPAHITGSGRRRRLAGVHGRPSRPRCVRAPPRRRVAAAAVGGPAAADRLPPAHVPGRHPVGRHRARRHPIAVAEAPPTGHRRRPGRRHEPRRAGALTRAAVSRRCAASARCRTARRDTSAWCRSSAHRRR